MAETAIENYIRAYVYSKTGEDVTLELKDFIAIRHVTKGGSTALAILWANVLQHINNYPNTKYSYKRSSDKSTGCERLTLSVDDITFTVLMKTGTLRIDGTFVYDWFCKKFKSLLDSYDVKFNEIYPSITLPKMNYKPVAGTVPDPDTSEYLALMSKRFSPTKSDINLEKRIVNHTKNLEFSSDSKSLLLSDDELNSKLDNIKQGAVKSGPQFIYPVWRSLLNRWFSQDGCRVYIVTPSLDAKCLHDMAELCIMHHMTAQLEAIYVRPRCDHKLTLSDIKKDVLNKFETKLQLFVEYKVFRKILIPLDVFHCKFIAAVKDDMAEVLLTSASFNGNHFEQQNVDSVMYVRLSAADFEASYLEPLANSLVSVP